MPKQTFFHLPKEKQGTIIQAAKSEFSRVALHEASIANIIKEADIPRGSFYQYFDDKEDLYYYLLHQIADENNDRFIAFLQEKNGDIFETLLDLFQYMIQNHGNEEHKSFVKNAFLNMNYKMENILANDIYQENKRSQYIKMISLINTTNLNVKDEQELHHIFKIIMAVTFQNLIQAFVMDLTEEEAVTSYIEQMELLKRGVGKKENSANEFS
ncbi:TetR family transcriptional regulator [Lederbergia citrisecunda]|uniref:TetR/AcrR family transcriptional regulator n=1 Tax=Lederbergia citrisecunda TaxID=2833583 RepID=UPI003D289551